MQRERSDPQPFRDRQVSEDPSPVHRRSCTSGNRCWFTGLLNDPHLSAILLGDGAEQIDSSGVVPEEDGVDFGAADAAGLDGSASVSAAGCG